MAQKDMEVEGALEAVAVLGSLGAEVVLGREVCFVMGGRGTVGDTQEQELGYLLRGILDQRC